MACRSAPSRREKGRATSLSVLLVLWIAWMAAMAGCAPQRAPLPPQVSSPSGPISQFQTRLDGAAEAAGQRVGAAILRLSGLGQEGPVVAVARNGSVSEGAVQRFASAMGRRGVRLTAPGEFLTTLVESQDLLQSPIFAPAPRAPLAQADILAIITARVQGDSMVVEAAALSLRSQEWPGQALQPGEELPGSRFRQVVRLPGLRPLVGRGYCNRSLPHDRWRYTAERAAMLDAQGAALLAAGGLHAGVSLEGDGRLERDVTTLSGRRPVAPATVAAVSFDPGRCEAQVLLLVPGQ